MTPNFVVIDKLVISRLHGNSCYFLYKKKLVTFSVIVLKSPLDLKVLDLNISFCI